MITMLQTPLRMCLNSNKPNCSGWQSFIWRVFSSHQQVFLFWSCFVSFCISAGTNANTHLVRVQLVLLVVWLVFFFLLAQTVARPSGRHMPCHLLRPGAGVVMGGGGGEQHYPCEGGANGEVKRADEAGIDMQLCRLLWAQVRTHFMIVFCLFIKFQFW